MLAAQMRLLNEQILETDRLIRTNARSTEVGRRLMEIPGVGPLLASALVGAIADPKTFKTGRNLAAWIRAAMKTSSPNQVQIYRLCFVLIPASCRR